jgi:AraC-like DNA-binding protein
VSDYVRFHDFPVAGIEAMTARTARSFPRHTHDQYGIGVIDSGGHASWSGRGQVEAGKGHFISVNPGEVHDGRAIDRRPRSWRILYFEPAVLEEARADILEASHPAFTFREPVFADEPMRQVFEHAFAHTIFTAPFRDKLACETAILNLIARLGVHSTARRPSDDRKPAPCIRRVRDKIDSDPAAPLTLVDLATEAGLTRYQLLRGFARELGLTPHAYVMQRRVALAQRLIRKGSTLADVAALAGFCDQSHLTRCFVRQLGITPGRFASHSA